MGEDKENFWPLSLFCASVWIWFYTFLIVWWTYTVTQAYKLHFSILPMILYPFGIALRDQKKFMDMKKSLAAFSKLDGQRLSLAETFSGPIFQITGLMGIAWMTYIGVKGGSVTFINEGIQYQMPLLLGVIIVKFVVLGLNKFRTSKKLFYINLGFYTIFLILVILIDYRIEIFG